MRHLAAMEIQQENQLVCLKQNWITITHQRNIHRDRYETIHLPRRKLDYSELINKTEVQTLVLRAPRNASMASIANAAWAIIRVRLITSPMS